jgi:hypothetical protein
MKVDTAERLTEPALRMSADLRRPKPISPSIRVISASTHLRVSDSVELAGKPPKQSPDLADETRGKGKKRATSSRPV